MDLHSIRQSLRTKSIYDLPLRVTYYARVSSESDEQLNSLGNQIITSANKDRKAPGGGRSWTRAADDAAICA
jgi:site-specific DNA recombinase